MLRSSTRVQSRSVLTLATTLCMLHLGTSHAVEVRHTYGARYSADFVRAYRPCTVPNDITSNGIPACSPALTSACSYSSAGLDLRKRENTHEINLDAFVNNVSGPGSCPTGPYVLQLGLRISVDDPACATGACTLLDVPLSIPLTPTSNDFKLNDFTLESALPGSPPAIANYEILDAVVIAPDGLPIAGAGTGESGADVRADLSTAYPPCTVPDTANSWGVPACSAPVWESACDFSSAEVDVVRTSPVGARIKPRGAGFIGAPGYCADGMYALLPRVRITTDDCGTLCTLVDIELWFPAIVDQGEISPMSFSLASALSFLDSDDAVELLGYTMRDAMGNLLAGVAVTPTLRIDRAHFAVAFKDLGDLSDDTVVMKGKLPYPPLDPTIGGATFTAADKDGVVYTATIPSGLWEVVRTPRKKWRYKDESGAINGVRRAEISEFGSSGTPPGFKVSLLAKDTNLGAADLPAVNLVVGVSNTGGGSEVATRGTVCRQSAKRLHCK